MERQTRHYLPFEVYAKSLQAYFNNYEETAGGSCAKADAPTLLARALGFARTGPTITAMGETILRSLVRAKLVEAKAGQVRVLRRSQ